MGCEIMEAIIESNSPIESVYFTQNLLSENMID